MRIRPTKQAKIDVVGVGLFSSRKANLSGQPQALPTVMENRHNIINLYIFPFFSSLRFRVRFCPSAFRLL